ncbi:MAG: thiolase domain-containing protein [Thermoplasmata archaeon]|nr:thiolase domain-containing protein [Thermoplasmata archaeon]
MTGVHVAATAVGRFGRRPEPLLELLAEVGERVLESVDPHSVDALIVGNMAASVLGETENLAARVADRLGLAPAMALRVDAASASGAAAFHAGVWALHGGEARRALVVAGEKMTDRPTAEVARLLGHSLADREARVGATMPALAALVTQVYQARHGLDERALDAVSVAARSAACRNPNAQFRTAVSAEEVASSRPIALPLRLLHCSAVSDGAAAAILEPGPGAASVLGLGQGFDTMAVTEREDVTSFRATRLAAQRAYTMAGLTRKSVDFAELHDAFAPFAVIDLEDVGLCGPGEGAGWFANGSTAPDGRCPVNASGGLLGRGHPVGASGLVQIVEVARQLTGDAGPIAIARRPTTGLAQSIGGLGAHNFVTILGKESAQ